MLNFSGLIWRREFFKIELEFTLRVSYAKFALYECYRSKATKNYIKCKTHLIVNNYICKIWTQKLYIFICTNPIIHQPKSDVPKERIIIYCQIS